MISRGFIGYRGHRIRARGFPGRQPTLARSPPMPISQVLTLSLMIALASPAVFAQENPKITEGVALCVKMREQIYQCQEDFADAFVAMRNPPPEERANMRKRALEEITADG